MTKDELYDDFIFEFNFLFFRNHLNPKYFIVFFIFQIVKFYKIFNYNKLVKYYIMT